MAQPNPSDTPQSGPLHQTSAMDVFRSCPLPMLLADASTGKILAANTAALDLLGYRGGGLIGAPLGVLDEGSAKEVSELLLLAATVGDDAPHRRTMRARNGASVPVDVRMVPWGDRGSQVALYLSDARGEQAAERERGRLRSQLWMAQKQEAVGRMAAGIAHDLNNLLSMVLLTAQSLSTDLGRDAISQAGLELIGDATLRARELTKGLLAFSTGEMLAPRCMSLNELVRAMEGIIRHTAPDSVDVAFRLDRRDTLVMADPGQMQQVLVNLVVNAWEAMPEGGTLIVSTEEVELDEESAKHHASLQAGTYVLLTVTDTGIGMDEETRSRMFDPLFSTRDREAGSGLGLTTVRGIVRDCGGGTWVTSQPGFGTTFRVYLPHISGARSQSDLNAHGLSASAPVGFEHVLLVEDDDRVRGLVEGVLRDLGYHVTATPSPEEAIELHEDLWPSRGQHPVDMLLTDVVMPGMSGQELALRLRVKREDLRVLYMSGYLDPEDTKNMLGKDVFLAKPFTRTELAVRMREVLEGPHEGAASA